MSQKMISSDNIGGAITIRFEGDSGDGIISMGKAAARTAARLGYHVYTYSTFLAVVRGGQVTFQLRIGSAPLLSQGDDPDILVALNRKAFTDAGPRVRPGGIILHPSIRDDWPKTGPDVRMIDVPIEELSIRETGSARCKNIVASGILLGLLGFSRREGEDVVREMFGGKEGDIADMNVIALGAGYEYGEQAGDVTDHLRFPVLESCRRLLLSGNEAVALGALVGGVRFFAGYPITPASEIMEWLAAEMPKIGGTMIQAEDEIAALAMCIGASFGGVKSMTATSGPGLSLMIELLALAGMAELPVVVIDVQRAGPSTGMPTKEAQGDLNLAIHGSHGEVPRVVIAPQSVADCFRQTIEAVNIAHRFHIPVIVLSSQSLSHRMQTINLSDLHNVPLFEEPFWKPGIVDEQYRRFMQTPDGMPSCRSIPGMEGGMYRAGGLEHDETGNPNFDPEVRRRMVERRRERMHAIQRAFHEMESGEFDCACRSELGLVSWGATASAVLEALQQLKWEGHTFCHLMPRILWPLPDTTFRHFFASGLKYLFVCELNATRQFAEILRARYTAELIKHGVEVISITKDDGLPFTPGELKTAILKELANRACEPKGM